VLFVHFNSVSCSYFHDLKNIYLILEFAPNGELFKSLAKMGGAVEEGQCRQYMRQMGEAIAYLHARNVAHRDLKPENVLIGEDGALKLADFGWSVLVPPQHPSRMTMCGTPEYLSPEMVAGCGHGLPVDLWALGIMMYEFLVGRYAALTHPLMHNADSWVSLCVCICRTPFFERKKTAEELAASGVALGNGNSGTCNVDDLLENECRSRVYARISGHTGGALQLPHPYASTVSLEAKSIIAQFLQPEPKSRMTAGKFLESAWLNK
jgi:serine/threonine protein kinase